MPIAVSKRLDLLPWGATESQEIRMSSQVLIEPRAWPLRLLLVVSLLACLGWLALCLLLMPIMLCVRIAQRKTMA
jgi:hypothetical protein